MIAPGEYLQTTVRFNDDRTRRSEPQSSPRRSKSDESSAMAMRGSRRKGESTRSSPPLSLAGRGSRFASFSQNADAADLVSLAPLPRQPSSFLAVCRRSELYLGSTGPGTTLMNALRQRSPTQPHHHDRGPAERNSHGMCCARVPAAKRGRGRDTDQHASRNSLRMRTTG